jgi:cytochrome c oxidase cbb3-type subunit III
MASTLSLVLLALALAPDVSGRWNGTAEMKNENGQTLSIPVLLILKQEGERVTGTAGPGDAEQHPIKNGQISGEKLTFEVEADNGLFRVELKVEADRIAGEFRRRGGDGSQQSGKFSATRAPEKNPFDTAADAAIGQRYFLGHCAQCHGPAGEGGRGINLTVGRYRMGGSDSELFRTIKRGIRESEMPGSDFSDTETWRLVAFVRRLARAGAEEKATGDAEAGRRLYESRGCAQCHMIESRGGVLGPTLTEIGLRRSLKFLEQSLTDPSADVAEDFQTVTVVTRSGQEVKGVRLNEDDYSVQLRDLSETIRSFMKSEVRQVRREKGSLMPSYGSLSLQERQGLVAYLSSLRGKS